MRLEGDPIGIIQDKTNGYWRIRYGTGVTDLINVRPANFQYRDPDVGDLVILRYRSSPSGGLYYPEKANPLNIQVTREQ